MHPRQDANPAQVSVPPQEVGRWGEDLALAVLERQGYTLLARNWRPTHSEDRSRWKGELDLVMQDREQSLVFIEVKTRSGVGYGHPLEAITAHKRQMLRHLAYAWVHENRTPCSSMRIDAIALCGDPGEFTFEHRQGVI